MNQTEYQDWWKLHIRTARGESLTAAEQSTYDVGLSQLQTEESVSTDVEGIRDARAALNELNRQCDQLRDRRLQLERRISQLESQLTEDMRRTLGIEE